MKFCEQCGSLIIIKTSTGNLEFYCEQCGITYQSQPEDTLMFEDDHEFSEIKEKSDALRHNALNDTARNLVDQECKKCKLPYKVKIYIDNTVPELICECSHFN